MFKKKFIRRRQMNIDRMINKVTASFATGIRGDLSIADFQKIDGNSAHILLEYQPTMGRPKGDDIERYFAKTFEGKIMPVMASCSIKPNCVSIVAQINTPVRAIEETQDRTKMVPVIAGLMYIDTELQDHWEVKDTEDGKKVLAKTTKENIEQIIAARRNRMFVTKSSNVSLASVAAAKEVIGAGDVVKVWNKGQCFPLEITAAIKGGFKGKTEEGKDIVVAKEQVLDLMKLALEKAPNEASKLQKYFEEAYGDKKYAKELTK